jgi:hypothetical protein
MIFEVEYILIPETFVRLLMKTREFDKYISKTFDNVEEVIIYKYKNARHVFVDESFVVEEQI